MTFDMISPWVQRALGLSLFALVVLTAVALVLVSGARLFQLRHREHHSAV